MMAMSGALNSRGFSESVSRGVLPGVDHITYEGVFNELTFDVGPKTTNPIDLHCGYARYQFPSSAFDSRINDYLAIFFKSERDGADRDARPLNATICLDVSGSMGGGMGGESKHPRTRLSLSLQAIKMFVSKLRPDDSFGLLTFNNSAEVIIGQTMRGEYDMGELDKLDRIVAGGGTTISAGLHMGAVLQQSFVNGRTDRENRIVMLTDVCDNSFAGYKKDIQALAEKSIHLTIIGISSEFESKVCEVFKNIRGFNYFCAVNEEDIKKYVFEQFDYVFLPVLHDVVLDIISPCIRSFEVYGSTDGDRVGEYNKGFQSEGERYTITKLPSVFPSALIISEKRVLTVGGLILVKVQRKEMEGGFRGELRLRGRGMGEEKYEIVYGFPEEEQFFSEECLREALDGYAFVSEMRSVLQEGNMRGAKEVKEKYLGSLKGLRSIVPKSKSKELEEVIGILGRSDE